MDAESILFVCPSDRAKEPERENGAFSFRITAPHSVHGISSLVHRGALCSVDLLRRMFSVTKEANCLHCSVAHLCVCTLLISVVIFHV